MGSSDDRSPISDQPTQDFSAANEEDLDFETTTADAELTAVPDQIGDYEIKSMLGKGGMGRVFLAEHIRMQREVAIKMLKPSRMGDQFAVDRFYSEVRAVSKLMHPNIVAAFDAGEFDALHYFVMEYVDGMTLTQWVSRSGPLDLSQAVAVIRQAGAGLLHAHRSGIVHRDVKPGNIMRAADGTIKVLDFGLGQIGSRVLDAPVAEIEAAEESDLKGRLIGTLAYMSPEQLESPESIDSRTDIYSLGCVLHFLLTARPPYTGGYLDQVYGHRHGEIPDLMQVRDDIDLNFANIFRRMLAKTPDARYASLDEVIDDLADYVDVRTQPQWLAEISRKQNPSDSTIIQGSTSAAVSTRVMGIDLGMFYAAASEATLGGDVRQLNAGDNDQTLLRTVLACEGEKLRFDQDAMNMRLENPKQTAHCLQMYIGKDYVDREFCGRRCPPEVLLSVLISRVMNNAWVHEDPPDHVAITVPSMYDQLHRKSIVQAATIAGIKSVRLVDRSLAAVQSTLLDSEHDSFDSALGDLETPADKTVLFVGLTGQASEIAVLRLESGRLRQLSSAGHWHTGSMPWLSRLVKIASASIKSQYGVDPQTSLSLGSALQMACEKALNKMLLTPTATVTVTHKGTEMSVTLDRAQWIQQCDDLLKRLESDIRLALKRAEVSRKYVNACVTMGPLLRIPEIKHRLFRKLHSGVQRISVERTHAARGAAACLATELPGRGALGSPPSCLTSQSIGILVADVKGRARILPIIPRGTLLPARTNRRLKMSKKSLTLVESTGARGDEWHQLGRYDFDVGQTDSKDTNQTRMIGFEIGANGMLIVRAQMSGKHGSETLDSLPRPVLSDDEIPKWSQWVATLR